MNDGMKHEGGSAYRLLIAILFIIGLAGSACNFEQVTQDVDQGMYFDVNSYLDKLTDEGFDTVRSVRKVVIHNGQQQKKSIEEYDLKQEWELMRRNDINTKALQGKYNVDSIRLNGDVRIAYYAQDQSFAVDSLFVTKSYDIIRSIKWNQSIQSPITDTRQEVIFKPESGIEVRKTIDPLLGQLDTFVVQLQWR